MNDEEGNEVRQDAPNVEGSPIVPVPLSADFLSAPDNADRDDEGRFIEGNAGGPGRPKGRGNLVPAELKNDVLAAYRERGGIAWLRGLKDPLFVRLVEKLLPRELAADLRVARADPENVKITVEHVEVLPTGQKEVIDSYALPAPGQNQHQGRDADGRAVEAPTDAKENT